MKLSIITINLNNKDGLLKTINSVLNQTFLDFEYIIIDGASIDGSVEVVNKYLPKINHFISEADSGIYSAMNKAIKIAQGEYCLFLNSGDFLSNKNALKKVFSLNINSDLIIGQQLFIDIHGKISHSPRIKYYEIDLNYFYSSTLPHQSTFIKRKLFQDVGLYKEEFKIVADWCFWVDAIVINKCSFSIINFNVSIMQKGGMSANIENCIHEMSEYLTEISPESIVDHWKTFIKISKKAHVYDKCKQNKLSSLLLQVAFYISKHF